jgi:hypothetical protein
MAYNISYTSLPSFTSNSIGNLLASQDYTTNYNGGSTVFTVSATPGIYLFTCLVGYGPFPANDSNIFRNTLTNLSTNTIICSYNAVIANGPIANANLAAPLSHAFSISSTSNLQFTIFGTSPNELSYSLVRLA